ncbi:MAG: hypothetical protein ACKO96_28495 [Flammeovirgaceae bacterium]
MRQGDYRMLKNEMKVKGLVEDYVRGESLGVHVGEEHRHWKSGE